MAMKIIAFESIDELEEILKEHGVSISEEKRSLYESALEDVGEGMIEITESYVRVVIGGLVDEYRKEMQIQLDINEYGTIVAIEDAVLEIDGKEKRVKKNKIVKELYGGDKVKLKVKEGKVALYKVVRDKLGNIVDIQSIEIGGEV